MFSWNPSKHLPVIIFYFILFYPYSHKLNFKNKNKISHELHMIWIRSAAGYACQLAWKDMYATIDTDTNTPLPLPLPLCSQEKETKIKSYSCINKSLSSFVFSSQKSMLLLISYWFFFIKIASSKITLDN